MTGGDDFQWLEDPDLELPDQIEVKDPPSKKGDPPKNEPPVDETDKMFQEFDALEKEDEGDDQGKPKVGPKKEEGTTDDDDPPVEYKLGDFGKQLVENKFFEKEPESVDDFIDKIDEITTNKVAETLKQLPLEAKSFLTHVIKGGSLENYKGVSTPEFDITNESGQEALVRHVLAKEGKDTIEQDALILTYKDKEILAAKAKAYDKQIKEEVVKTQKAVDDSITANLNNQRNQILSSIQDMETRAKEIKEVAGFAIKPEEIKELISFGMRPSIKTPDGDLVTAMDSAIMKIEAKDPAKFLALMKFIKADCDPAVFKIAKMPAPTHTKKVVENKQNPNPKVLPLGDLVTLIDNLKSK